MELQGKDENWCMDKLGRNIEQTRSVLQAREGKAGTPISNISVTVAMANLSLKNFGDTGGTGQSFLMDFVLNTNLLSKLRKN